METVKWTLSSRIKSGKSPEVESGGGWRRVVEDNI